MDIKHGCVTLRAIEERDLDLLFFMINDPYIECMTEGWHLPVSLQEQKQWIASYKNTNTDIRLMIELSNKKIIGMISLTNIDWKNKTGEIGIKIHAALEDRIKGDVLDAYKALLEYAFYELGLNCINHKTLDYNIFSLKLTDRMGFKREGLLRERIFKNGKYHNQIIGSILKKDFEEKFKDELS
jgi:RimJ/RimL family protein N-acetyltransferase